MNAPQLLEHWYRTTDWLLDKCDRFPKHTRFTISGRVANIAIETLELIVAAAYTREKREKLHLINLNLEKLRFLMRLCFERRYLNLTQYEFIQQEMNTAGRMCGGWLRVCKE